VQVRRRHHLLVLWQQEGDGHSPRHAACRRLRTRQQNRAAQGVFGAPCFHFIFHFVDSLFQSFLIYLICRFPELQGTRWLILDACTADANDVDVEIPPLRIRIA
jgi:hypothetical protein